MYKVFLNVIKVLIYINFGWWLLADYGNHFDWLSLRESLPLTSKEEVSFGELKLTQGLFVAGILVVVIEITESISNIVEKVKRKSK